MKILDLTLTLEHGTRGVEFTTKYTVAENGWNARTPHLYSHGGTQIVESLTNLDQPRGPQVFFGALPLKVADGDRARP